MNYDSAALEVFFSSGSSAHKSSKTIEFSEMEAIAGTTSNGHKCWIQDKPIRVFCTCEHFRFRILPRINESLRNDKQPIPEGCKHIVALAAHHLPRN